MPCERRFIPQNPLPLGMGSSQNAQFLACDFLTVETFTLQTVYVLFFIEHATRRVYLAGCTAHPNVAWMAQQARQMTWELEGRELPMRFLIHDHDTKFTERFDTVFESAGI
jgi:putative transposase